jgi:hypothetical protein
MVATADIGTKPPFSLVSFVNSRMSASIPRMPMGFASLAAEAERISFMGASCHSSSRFSMVKRRFNQIRTFLQDGKSW